MGAREDAYEELLAAVAAAGYPEELATVLADELRGEKSMHRMASNMTTPARLCRMGPCRLMP